MTTSSSPTVAELIAAIRAEGAQETAKEIEKVGKEGDKSQEKLLTFGDKGSKSLTDLAKKAAKAALAFVSVAAAVSQLARGAVLAKEFESSLAELSAITGAVGDDLDFLSGEALRFSKTMGVAATDVSSAFKLVASAKPDLLENAQALSQVTEEVLTLSKASGEDLASSANAVGSALNQYAAGAEEAARFVNVLAAGSKFGASEVRDTTEALRDSGTVASAAGISFEELNASIQSLASVAIKGSQAGTAMRNVILRLQKQSNDDFNPAIVGLTTALDNLNKANLSTTDSIELFGLENVTAAQALIRQSDQVGVLTEKLTGTNTAYEQAAIRSNTLAGDLNKLSTTWDSFLITISQGSNSEFRILVQTITDLVTVIANVNDEVDSSTGLWTSLSYAGLTVFEVVNRLRLEFIDLGDWIGYAVAQVVTLFTQGAEAAARLDKDRASQRAQLEAEIKAWDDKIGRIREALSLEGEARIAARQALIDDLNNGRKNRDGGAGGGMSIDVTGGVVVEDPLAAFGGGGSSVDTEVSEPTDAEEEAHRAAERARKEAEARAEVVEASLMTEEERLDESLWRRHDMLEQAHNDNLISDARFIELEQRLFDEHHKKLTSIRKKALTEDERWRMMSFRNQAKGVAGFLMSITATVADSNRTMFEINKAATLANAILSLHDAATGAYAFGARVGGPAVGAAFATLATLAQLAQIQAIYNTSFGGGAAPSTTAGSTTGGVTTTAPLAQSPPAINAGDGTSGNTPRQVSITFDFSGALVTPQMRDFVREEILPNLRSVLDDEDEILITQGSQQYLELTGTGG